MVPIPPPISQFDLSPSYINILENGSTPLPPITQGGDGGANYALLEAKVIMKSMDNETNMI